MWFLRFFVFALVLACVLSRGTKQDVNINQYNSFDDINDYIVDLHTHSQYGQYVTRIYLGKSYEGRNTYLVRVAEGGTDNKPAIFIDAGMGGRDWISPATVLQLIDRLVKGDDEETQSLRQTVVWYFVPVGNPDGYEYTRTNDRNWMKTRSDDVNHPTCLGTDANRNWDFQWGVAGSSSWPCDGNYHGSHPFSEVETSQIRNYILGRRTDIKAYLNFQAFGQYWLYPWSYTFSLPSDYEDLDALAQEAVAALQAPFNTEYTVGSSAMTVGFASGSSADWAKGVAGIKYSYTIKLRDTGLFGYELPAFEIVPSGVETYQALLVIGKFVRDNYTYP